jgi:hypothetical protein
LGGPRSNVYIQVQRGRDAFSFTATLQTFEPIMGAIDLDSIASRRGCFLANHDGRLHKGVDLL